MYSLGKFSWSNKWLVIPPLVPAAVLAMIWLAERAHFRLDMHSIGGGLALVGFLGTFVISGLVLVAALVGSTLVVVSRQSARSRSNLLAIAFAGVALAGYLYYIVDDLL